MATSVPDKKTGSSNPKLKDTETDPTPDQESGFGLHGREIVNKRTRRIYEV